MVNIRSMEIGGASVHARRNSARNLQELYTVAVAAALGFAAERAVSVTGDDTRFDMDAIWPLIAFLATLIPFYHGAVRHLESTFVDEPTRPALEGRRVRRGTLLADFLLLFAEGFIFIAIARTLTDPEMAARWLLFLLVFDALWGVGVNYLGYDPPKSALRLPWVIINTIAAPMLLLALILPGNSITLPLVFGGLVVRTVIDYWVSWEFYFPSD